MRGTIALPLQARIIALRFVDCRTVEVRQPSLDPPCRHDHQDPFFRESDRYSCLVARIRKLSHACGNTALVAIEHDDKLLRHSLSPALVFGELRRKAVSYEGLARASFAPKSLHPQYTVITPHLPEKLADEGLVLLVFTQHDELDSLAQRSQPLATNSESFNPTDFSSLLSAVAGGRPTVMTPEVSRCNIMPCSYPR
jgi:hypothetical protein